jgi:AcrR family transcriptional regulator
MSTARRDTGGRRRATTDTILAAAELLFAEHGYAAVTVRDIGAAAGVSHALVHRYLGSKESIYLAVMEKNEGLLLRAAGDTDDLPVALSRLIHAGLDHHRVYLRLIAQSALHGMPFETAIGHLPATEHVIAMAEARSAARAEGGAAPPPRLVIAALCALFIEWVVLEPWLVPATHLEDMDEATRTAYLERVLLGVVDRLLPPAATQERR